MAGGVIWKVGTGVFGTTTLVLGLVLLALPRVEIAELTPRTARADRALAPGEPVAARSHVKVDGGGAGATPARSADSSAPWTAAIAPNRDLRDVLALHVFDRDDVEEEVRAPRHELLRRLRQDEARAIRILEDWLRRRDEIRVRMVGSPPLLLCVYAELLGRDAIPLLRTLDQSDPTALDWNVVLPLVVAGDEEARARVDREQRATVGNAFLSPEQVARAGGGAVDLIRGWTLDDVENPRLREAAVRTLFRHGTDDDRRALWEGASIDDSLRLFFFGPSEAWNARLRSRVIESLDDPDPWIRVHAAERARHLPRGRSEDTVNRALEIATTDAALPCPGGRDAQRWAELRAGLRAWEQRTVAAARSNDAWIDMLGDE